MEVQGSLMMAFFLMVVISLHFLHPEATTIDLPSARNRRSEFASNINTPRTSFVGIETHDNDQLTSNINQNTKTQLRRQSESASNITSPRTSFVGIETNDNDQLTSYINQNIKTQLRKSDKYCEDNDGKCMKKKEIKECLGKINKKFKCSNKKEICCEEDPLKSQIDNLEMEQNATHDFMIKLETNLDHLETEQNTTFEFIKKLETQLDNIEKKLLAKNPTTKTTTPGVTTTKTSTPGVTTAKTSTPEVTTTKTSTLEVTTTKTSTPAVTTTPTPIITCEDLGGVKIGHQCFEFRDEVLNWDDAKAACESSGSQLASLEDPGAVRAYKDKTYGGTQFWVGGSDTLNDGSWVWLNGKPFDHSFPWAPSEPNGGTNENCLMTWVNNGYNDLGCHGTLRFICELGTTCEDLGGEKVGYQCLKFRDEVLNWDDAKAACASSGSQLASLEDPQAVIEYKNAKYGGTPFWVGGSDALNEGSWVWLNGKPFDNSFQWGTNEPNNHGGNEDCLSLWGHGYNDWVCHVTSRFICALATTTEVPTTPTPISTCEDLGGVKIGQQCFKFHNDEKLSWDDAKAACESSGSQLASLEDPGAVLVHKNEIYGDAGWDAQFWVGGSDALNDGSWVWLNGKPFDHSFPWGASEPNGGENENCLMTWFNNGYNDLYCHGTLRFICELGGSK